MLSIIFLINIHSVQYTGPDSVPIVVLVQMFDRVAAIYDKELGIKLKLVGIEERRDGSRHLDLVENGRVRRFLFLNHRTQPRRQRRIHLAVTGPVYNEGGDIFCAGRAWVGGYLSKKLNFGWATAKTQGRGFVISVLVMAHELGHVLSLNHTDKGIMHAALGNWQVQGLDLGFAHGTKRRVERYVKQRKRQFCQHKRRPKRCRRKLRA